MIGYDRYETPPEPKANIEGMYNECQRLRKTINEAQAERDETDGLFSEFQHLDYNLREKILESFDDKIKAYSEQYGLIAEHLHELGYCADGM